MLLDILFTPAAANLTGYASNVTGAGPWTPTATVAGDNMAHQVTIRNDTANSHSAKTITLTGTDSSGRVQTEQLAAPGVSATVTSTKFFQTLTSVAISSTIGADTFDIGWAATSVSHPILLKPENGNLPAFQAVVTGTINFDLETTLADPFKGTNVHDATFANDANWTAKTASVAPTAIAVRATAVRLAVNSITAGATVRLFGAIPE